uniref:Uncharacterized protein n=1 Tax=Rhizophora mucronata TaxID=61149 RepID=A0A2P2IWL8_RHIMU
MLPTFSSMQFILVYLIYLSGYFMSDNNLCLLCALRFCKFNDQFMGLTFILVT